MGGVAGRRAGAVHAGAGGARRRRDSAGELFSRPLARLEGRIALGKLFSRFPRLRLAVTPDSPAYRDSTLLHGLVRLLVYVG
jgi:hypothetical protein